MLLGVLALLVGHLSPSLCIEQYTMFPNLGLGSTWDPDINPGEDCLPYDGSRIPDCSKFIDPILKEPYYHEHSGNCSRFWECGPELETCLFECAMCCNRDEGDKNCNPGCIGNWTDGVMQWALTFDERYHTWPLGPTCVWPRDYIGNCTNIPGPCDCKPWQTCINDEWCSPQCLEDKHCPNGYFCDDCHWCKPIQGCNSTDSNCEGFDVTCNVPPPHHDTCFYCDGNDCKPGCADDSVCIETEYPKCRANHECGCDKDSDCKAGYICNSDHKCDLKPTTQPPTTTPDAGCKNTDELCDGHDTPCNVPPPHHDTCFFCDGDDCKPGCKDDTVCLEDEYPKCRANHECGCDKDADCENSWICNKDDHRCEPKPGLVLLETIKVYTESCTGCDKSDEGLEVYLVGPRAGDWRRNCTTNRLDHAGKQDFNAGGATFEGKPDQDLLGVCYHAPLNSQLKTDGGSVEWLGTGTWTPASPGICVDWYEIEQPNKEHVWTCTLEDSGVGNKWNLKDCNNDGGVKCP